MTDKAYLKIIVSLGEELERVASAKPYDPDEYNRVISSIESTNRIWWRSRRRQNRLNKASIYLLIVVLAWSFYKILSWLRL